MGFIERSENNNFTDDIVTPTGSIISDSVGDPTYVPSENELSEVSIKNICIKLLYSADV